MKTITLSFYDNRPSMHVSGTVYGFIAVNPESASMMRDEFRSAVSECGIEYWTPEQVMTLAQTLEKDTVLQIVK